MCKARETRGRRRARTYQRYVGTRCEVLGSRSFSTTECYFDMRFSFSIKRQCTVLQASHHWADGPSASSCSPLPYNPIYESVSSVLIFTSCAASSKTISLPHSHTVNAHIHTSS